MRRWREKGKKDRRRRKTRKKILGGIGRRTDRRKRGRGLAPKEEEEEEENCAVGVSCSPEDNYWCVSHEPMIKAGWEVSRVAPSVGCLPCSSPVKRICKTLREGAEWRALGCAGGQV